MSEDVRGVHLGEEAVRNAPGFRPHPAEKWKKLNLVETRVGGGGGALSLPLTNNTSIKYCNCAQKSGFYR